MRGYWIHEDKQIGLERPGRRRRTTNQYKRGCGYANPYIGYSDAVKRIDTRCRKCGKRVQFNNPISNPRLCKYGYFDGRGSVRQVRFKHLPNHSPGEIAKICLKLNVALVLTREHEEGFVTALELRDKKKTDKGGGN